MIALPFFSLPIVPGGAMPVLMRMLHILHGHGHNTQDDDCQCVVDAPRQLTVNDPGPLWLVLCGAVKACSCRCCAEHMWQSCCSTNCCQCPTSAAILPWNNTSQE